MTGVIKTLKRLDSPKSGIDKLISNEITETAKTPQKPSCSHFSILTRKTIYNNDNAGEIIHCAGYETNNGLLFII